MHLNDFKVIENLQYSNQLQKLLDLLERKLFRVRTDITITTASRYH